MFKKRDENVYKPCPILTTNIGCTKIKIRRHFFFNNTFSTAENICIAYKKKYMARLN